MVPWRGREGGICSRATHDHAKSATHWGCSVQITHVEVRIGGQWILPMWRARAGSLTHHQWLSTMQTTFISCWPPRCRTRGQGVATMHRVKQNNDLSLPLFPFARGEVLPATSSPPHLIIFSTIICLLSSSSNSPSLLPFSHLS